MIFSLGVTPDVRRDIRQGLGCEKEVLNNFIDAGNGRCVNLKAASDLMFSTPVMREMDAWIFAWPMIHAALRRRWPMLVAVLTLPCWDQLSAVVL